MWIVKRNMTEIRHESGLCCSDNQKYIFLTGSFSIECNVHRFYQNDFSSLQI